MADNEVDPVLLLLSKIREQLEDVMRMVRDEKERVHDESGQPGR